MQPTQRSGEGGYRPSMLRLSAGDGGTVPLDSPGTHPFHSGYQVASPKRLPPLPGARGTPINSPPRASHAGFSPHLNPLASPPRSPIHLEHHNYSSRQPPALGIELQRHVSKGESNGKDASTPVSATPLMVDTSPDGLRGESDDERPLHVRLLKERIELEVAMRREGTRCFVFALFSICLCVALSIQSDTPGRNAARWLIQQGLSLDDIEDVNMPGDVYDYMTTLSANSRQFFPLSSTYVEDELAAVLIQERQDFPGGPLQVPGDAQPSLRMQWSMTTWISFDNPMYPRPEKSLIVRKYLPDDSSSLSCWAWYAKGPNAFVFEYGRHNMDEGYVQMEINFVAPYNMSTPEKGEMRLSGIVLNATHLTAYKESESEQVAVVTPLSDGFPTDCENGHMQVGGSDIQLADLKFHPRELGPEQFVEIMEGGQTLFNIASGTAPNPAPDLSGEAVSEATTLTQEMVADASAAQVTLTKVVGNLVDSGIFLLSGGKTVTDSLADLLPSPDGSGGTPVSGGSSFDLVADTWDVVTSDGSVAPLDLSPAFEALLQQQGGPGSFTLTWWAKAARPVQGLTELLFNAPDGMPRLKMDFGEGTAYDGIDGWETSFYNSPRCFAPEDTAGLSADTLAQCAGAPSWWCQAPMESEYAGTYDGIWRHIAVRFEYASSLRAGASVSGSSLELFQDGQLLCGADFRALAALVPQGSLESPSAVEFGTLSTAIAAVDADAALALKDVRLYSTALSNVQLKELGLDPAVRECTDLETTRDNPNFTTSFGMSCSDFSLLSTKEDSSGNLLAPSACQSSPDIRPACPISCVEDGNPICWDRMPPMIAGAPPEPVEPVTAEYTSPRRFLVELYPAPTEDLQARLLAAQSWSDGSNGTWSRILDSISLSSYNEIATAVDAPALSANSGHYLLRDESSVNDTFWWRSAACPGSAGAQSQGTVSRLHARLCGAERTYRDQLASLVEELGSMDGIPVTTFPGGLLSSGSSFSLWFWAKATGVEERTSPAVAGTDADNNICFFIEGDSLYVPARGSDAEPLSIRLPNHDAIQDDTWIFYAVVMNQQRGVLSFAVNDQLQEVELEGDADAWGCTSLADIVNAGTELQLSPIRVARSPMLPGTLQKLFHDLLPAYRTVLTGVQSNVLELMSRVDRPRDKFKMRVVALSPPLSLQQRVNISDPNAACQGTTIEAYNEALNRARQLQCESPYKCDEADTGGDLAMSCYSDDLAAPATFMGRTPIVDKAGEFFPEFMWVLENSILVRGSEDFSPSDSYIDLETVSTVFYFVFYAPDSQIATVVIVNFDFTSARIDGSYEFLQIKFLTQAQADEWLAYLIAATVFVFIHMLLAVPAGLQEAKNLFSATRRKLRQVAAHDLLLSPQHQRQNDRYTQDTSQPDLLDVIFSAGLFVYCIYMIWFVSVRVFQDGPQLFADIAIIDWASSDSFATKTSTFLDAMSHAIALTYAANNLREVAFWVLIGCCIRVILYLKLHPRIAAVTQTFEVCFWELLNFFFSFGVIYLFLAFIAHMKFGFMYDEFATLGQSMITQFSILIGDDAPDYASNSTLFIYVVIYVFVCTLALLNFLLAIVVAGYDSVREIALENQVATSFLADAWGVPVDGFRWLRHHRWPSKLRLLNTMFGAYPAVFNDADSQVYMGEAEFIALVQAASRRATPADAAALFRHYHRYPFLLADSH